MAAEVRKSLIRDASALIVPPRHNGQSLYIEETDQDTISDPSKLPGYGKQLIQSVSQEVIPQQKDMNRATDLEQGIPGQEKTSQQIPFISVMTGEVSNKQPSMQPSMFGSLPVIKG